MDKMHMFPILRGRLLKTEIVDTVVEKGNVSNP